MRDSTGIPPIAAGYTDRMSRYNPDIHHRRSIRLRGYDYRAAAAYFVTICIQNREPLFGAIEHGSIQLSQ